MVRPPSYRRGTRRKTGAEQRGVAEGYRSGLEKKTQDDLDARNVPYLYEKGRMVYVVPARDAKYTPDFFLRRDRGPVHPLPEDWYLSEDWWREHFVVETKGRFVVEDRQKHLLIAKQFPFSDIRFVFSRSKSPIRKGSKTTYAMWCEKHGFVYADKEVPDEWFSAD